MATQEKTWNVANRLHSQKDSDNPEVNHIIAGADEIYDDAKGAKQSDINAQTDAALADRYTKEETYNREEIEELVDPTNYVSVVATNATTAATDILPTAGEVDTIYRVGNWNGTQYDPTMYALFAWNGSVYVCLAVRSFVGEVYDVSVNHPDGQGNPTPYADLTAALGTNGANIPAGIRRGGMSIKFIQGNVQSIDNKYVQYRLMADSWSINTNDWSFCGDDVLVDNPEYIEVKTDSESKILEGIKTDGTKEVNIPTTFKDTVTIKGSINNEELTNALNTKVNKVEGKGLSTNDYDNTAKELVDSNEYLENPEFVRVYTDSEDKILWAIKADGDIYFGVGVPTQVKDYIQNKISELSLDEYEDIVAFLNGLEEGDKTLQELLNLKANIADVYNKTQVYTKNENGAIFAVKVNPELSGKVSFDKEIGENDEVNEAFVQHVDNPEFVAVWLDKYDRILFGVHKDGNFHFGYGIPKQIQESINSKVDKENGKSLIDAIFVEKHTYIDDTDERLELKTDEENKIVSYRSSDGVLHEEAGLETSLLIANKVQFRDEGLKKLKSDITKGNGDLESRLADVNVIFNMPIPHPTKEDGKELYSELSVYNVERKANNFRFVRWKSLSPIPRGGGVPFFPAGDMIGIPYASCWEIDKIVGYNISFVTFMTAANNPYSMLYTENLRDNGSVYGFSYYQPARGTVEGWAGMVCSVLTGFATGMKYPHHTDACKYFYNIGQMVKVYPQNANGVRIGDILWESGHTRLVQNVWRDEHGVVKKIEVSTGGWPYPQDMFNSQEAFNEDLANRKAIIYRNTQLYKNDKYEDIPFPVIPPTGPLYPSDSYSHIPSEPYQFNDDICTFAGDYACFREGYRIVLNYNLKEDNAWESVELYKNDELYGTYLLSSDIGTYDRGPENYPAEKAALVASHSFDLSFLNLTYGEYKARLADGNGNYSDYTYFEILETKVSYTGDFNKEITVKFNSHNGNPSYLRLSNTDGLIRGVYEFTSSDITKGEVTINPTELITSQNTGTTVSNITLKVFFDGKYGNVTNEPILLS